MRPSRKGNHCCVTLVVQARSALQVQAIYEALRKTDDLVMLL